MEKNWGDTPSATLTFIEKTRNWLKPVLLLNREIYQRLLFLSNDTNQKHKTNEDKIMFIRLKG